MSEYAQIFRDAPSDRNHVADSLAVGFHFDPDGSAGCCELVGCAIATLEAAHL